MKYKNLTKEQLITRLLDWEDKYPFLRDMGSQDKPGHQSNEIKPKNEEILLRTIIDNIPDSIYCKDLHCRKTLVNLAEINYTKANSEEELLGKDDFAFYPKELAEGFFADDQTVLQSGNPVINREEYIIDGEGKKRWLLSSKIPLRNSNNKIIGLIGIGRDITDRKINELLVKEQQEEIEAQNEEYQQLSQNEPVDKKYIFILFLLATWKPFIIIRLTVSWFFITTVRWSCFRKGGGSDKNKIETDDGSMMKS